jgi:hypothetical protein
MTYGTGLLFTQNSSLGFKTSLGYIVCAAHFVTAKVLCCFFVVVFFFVFLVFRYGLTFLCTVAACALCTVSSLELSKRVIPCNVSLGISSIPADEF